MDRGYEKNLRLAARRHDLVAIVVEDPAEYDLPDVGWMSMRDSETGSEYLVNTSRSFSQISVSREDGIRSKGKGSSAQEHRSGYPACLDGKGV